MNDLQDFLDLLKTPDYRSRYLIAKRGGTCVACGNNALPLRDPSARLEYGVSALCQKCQHRFLGTDAGEASPNELEEEPQKEKNRPLGRPGVSAED